MADKTRFFRVATEGATSDGRTIERSWIEQMAKNYKPATYTARVNMEHYRGVTPDGPFKALGDVTALNTEEVDGKLVLLAQIQPTPDLIAYNQAKQKVFTSIEVNPSFADTKEAYLVGLAVTDSPASLGTDYLQFCAGKGDASPLAPRKQGKDNLFTAGVEAKLELETPAATTTDPVGDFFTRLSTRFFSGAAPAAVAPAAAAEPTATAAPAATADFSALRTEVAGLFRELGEGMRADREAARTEFAKLRGDFDAFRTKVESTDADTTQRPPATGPSGGQLTYAQSDC